MSAPENLSADQFAAKAKRTEHTTYCPYPHCDHTFMVGRDKDLTDHLVGYHRLPRSAAAVRRGDTHVPVKIYGHYR